jgi:phosphoribosyl-ATP pyrophosphohydrolase
MTFQASDDIRAAQARLAAIDTAAASLRTRNPIDVLFVELGRDALPPRTTELLAASTKRKSRKLVEEATEVAIEALKGRRKRAIMESVDLLYHLVVLWRQVGIHPDAVWAEMERRQAELGIAEKLPKRAAKLPAPAGEPARADRRPAYVDEDASIGPLYPSRFSGQR